MKKHKYIGVMLFFYIFILYCISIEANQIPLAGQLSTSLSTLYSIQSELIFLPQVNLDLELFFTIPVQ